MCVIAFCHNIHRHHIQVQPIRARRVIFDEFQEIIQINADKRETHIIF